MSAQRVAHGDGRQVGEPHGHVAKVHRQRHSVHCECATRHGLPTHGQLRQVEDRRAPTRVPSERGGLRASVAAQRVPRLLQVRCVPQGEPEAGGAGDVPGVLAKLR